MILTSLLPKKTIMQLISLAPTSDETGISPFNISTISSSKRREKHINQAILFHLTPNFQS